MAPCCPWDPTRGGRWISGAGQRIGAGTTVVAEGTVAAEETVVVGIELAAVAGDQGWYQRRHHRLPHPELSGRDSLQNHRRCSLSSSWLQK